MNTRHNEYIKQGINKAFMNRLPYGDKYGGHRSSACKPCSIFTTESFSEPSMAWTYPEDFPL